MTVIDYVSIGLAVAIVAVIVLSLIQRIVSKKGIGWQFIRLNVILVSLLLVAILALNDKLSEAIIGFIALAVGYAFGKAGSDE